MTKRYTLSAEAGTELENLLSYTLNNHGQRQARKYSHQLLACMDNLAKDNGHKAMRDIDSRMFYVHCQHHYIFGLRMPDKSMVIIAILHERMDLIARISSRLKK